MIAHLARCLRVGLAAVLFGAAATPVAGRAVPRDTTRLTFGAGAAFDAHTDLLASPFRQSGVGVSLDAGLARGPLSLDLLATSVGTSSRLTGTDAGVEDGWMVGLDVAWLRPVGDGGRTTWRVGGALSGLAFVRRHHYGSGAGREYFADLMVPLSAVGEASRRLGSTRLEERVGLALATLLFRSPYAATKTFPTASLAAPGSLWLVRHRLRASWRMSPRTRFLLTHEASLYDTQRNRLVRVVQQRLALGVVVALGGT